MPQDPLRGATIVFDLDGTLVDTAPDLIRALHAVMQEEGLAPPAPAALRHFVGHGARALLHRGAALSGQEFSAPRLDALTERFIGHYRAGIAELSRPFAGAEAALDALRARGAILAVCTNKHTDLSLELLNALGMAHRFAAIIGADAATRRKPDPQHVLETIFAARGQPHRAIMIGDTDADVTAAKAASIPAIAVRFGYSLEVDALGADAILEAYGDLPDLIDRLLPA